MVKVGLVLNLIGVVVITVVFYVLGVTVFGIESGALPDWAAGGSASRSLR